MVSELPILSAMKACPIHARTLSGDNAWAFLKASCESWVRKRSQDTAIASYNYVMLTSVLSCFKQRAPRLVQANTFCVNIITLHYTLHYIALNHHHRHHITLHYITLHCITSHHITLHHIASHHITLHYIASHCITFYSSCIDLMKQCWANAGSLTSIR